MSNKMYQKQKKSNPALQEEIIRHRIKKAMDEARLQGMDYTILAYNVILASVLTDKTNLTDKEVQDVVDRITYLADSIVKNYVTIPELIKTLKEEYQIKISDERLLKYYPELEGYMESDKK